MEIVFVLCGVYLVVVVDGGVVCGFVGVDYVLWNVMFLLLKLGYVVGGIGGGCYCVIVVVGEVYL